MRAVCTLRLTTILVVPMLLFDMSNYRARALVRTTVGSSPRAHSEYESQRVLDLRLLDDLEVATEGSAEPE